MSGIQYGTAGALGWPVHQAAGPAPRLTIPVPTGTSVITWPQFQAVPIGVVLTEAGIDVSGAGGGGGSGTISSTTPITGFPIGYLLSVGAGNQVSSVNPATLGAGSATWGGITGTLSAQTDLNAALNGKQATLVSGTNLRTVNGQTLLGSTDITIAGGAGAWGSITGTLASQTDLQTALNTKQATLVGVAGAGQNLRTVNGNNLLGTGDVVITGGAGTVTNIATTAPIAGGPITGTGTISHDTSGVAAGTYQGLTVNATGHVTAATNQNYATTASLAGFATTAQLANYTPLTQHTALEARVAALEGAAPPSAPTITSPTTAAATEGTAFGYTIVASQSPTSYALSANPAWLSLTGGPPANIVSGTPPAGSAGTSPTFTVTATNAQGTSAPVTVTIGPIAPPASGWSMTYTFPTPPTGFTYGGGGDIPLSSLTGWNAGTMAADWTDANLYGPPAPANQAAVPIQLYATFSGQSEVLVAFDLFPDTPAPNRIDTWGFDSSTNSIYIQGSNGTGQPIQLRIVRA